MSYSPFIPCLIQQPFCLILVSTTKLNSLELVGGSYCPRKTFLYGQWCVAGLSVLNHRNTAPGSTFILTWAGGEGMTPILHFFYSCRELGELPYPHDFAVSGSHSRFWALDAFPHHQKSTLGSLSNGWKFVVCEFRFWNCCMCVFTSRG